jgi:membrane protease YdiL (CAAX protease family)
MPWDFWVIFLVLAVLIPWRGRMRLQRLLAQPQAGTKEKLVLYGSTMAFQWMLMGVVAWRAFAHGLTTVQLGLDRRLSVELVLAGALGAAALGVFQWFNLRRVSRMSGPVPDLMRKLSERLLPIKAVEMAPYCALAVTAGVCEEFLYRGFVIAALARAGMTTWLVVVLSSVLFGLAHAYQGKSGIVGTTFMGFVLSAGRLIFQSLIPVMIWHSAIDIAAGIAGPQFLLQVERAD